MINIYYEFDGKNAMGEGRCESKSIIFDNYRDISNVDKVVKEVKKLFNSKNTRNETVTFAYTKRDYSHENTGRMFRLYGDEITRCYWKEGYSNSIGIKVGTKMTTKLIKEMYLDCADRAIKYESEKEEAI